MAIGFGILITYVVVSMIVRTTFKIRKARRNHGQRSRP
jgi:hypothetical protein